MIAWPATVFAAGFSNTAHSGTSTSMAGVGVANPDEPNTNFYNPSSMAFDDDWNVYLGSTLLVPSIDYTSPDGEIREQTEQDLFYPPNFNAAVPLPGDFAAGVSVAFPWGLGVAWPDDWHGRETFKSQSLETINVNPNVAWQVPGIDLGISAGVQVLRSAIRQEQTQIRRDDTEVDVSMGGTGYGLGAALSSQYRPTDEITVGASYRSASTIEFDGDVRFSDDVEGTPFEQRMRDQSIDTEVTVPHTINAGVGWQATEPLWIGLDVNYMTWRTYDQVEIRYSQRSPEAEPDAEDPTQPSTVQEANWHDAVAVRLGSQLQIVDDIKGRAGIGFDMTPVPDETVGPSLPDNHRLIGSLGFGYNYEKFRTDLAYQYVMPLEREITNGNVDGAYNMGSHIIGLNFGYGF